MANTFQELLDGNSVWVKGIEKTHPDLFENMAEGQHPQFLWIGCADSRVPAEEITNSLPGDIFVQRNVANMVVHTDYNLLSVVNYAVKALGVKHIIICGHYGCGGVKAAMGTKSFGLLDNWLCHIKDVHEKHAYELGNIRDEKTRWNKFVELNVEEQVKNMAKLSFIQEEWQKGEFPYIHGWVFDIEDGHLKNLQCTVNKPEQLAPIFRYKKEE
jgi:carbonic anhydrase